MVSCLERLLPFRDAKILKTSRPWGLVVPVRSWRLFQADSSLQQITHQADEVPHRAAQAVEFSDDHHVAFADLLQQFGQLYAFGLAPLTRSWKILGQPATLSASSCRSRF